MSVTRAMNRPKGRTNLINLPLSKGRVGAKKKVRTERGFNFDKGVPWTRGGVAYSNKPIVCDYKPARLQNQWHCMCGFSSLGNGFTDRQAVRGRPGWGLRARRKKNSEENAGYSNS